VRITLLRKPLTYIVVSIASALSLFAIMRLDLFQIVKDVPIDQLRAQNTVSISNRVYFPGECKVQLYGWMNSSPGPTDAADQYFKIRKLNATLDSESITSKEDVFDGKGLDEHIWTIHIPRMGVLTVNVEDYETPGDSITYGDIFLECNDSVSKTVTLGLLAISLLSGLIGFIFFCVIIFSRMRSKS
jgi:hypothetical protein